MPRKPDHPRPSRRYNPMPADLPLDRLNSASAIIAPPGFGVLPMSLAALFAEAGPDAQALSFQVQTQTAALDEGPDPPVGGPSLARTAGGGSTGAAEPASTGAATTAASIALTTAAWADEGAGPLATIASAGSFGGGGGALPGRGSGPAPGPGRPSAANAQPGSRPSGGSGLLGVSFGPGATGNGPRAAAGLAPATTGPAGSAVPAQPGATTPGTSGAGQAAPGPVATAQPETPTQAAANASSAATAASQSGRAGHPTVQNFGPQSSAPAPGTGSSGEGSNPASGAPGPAAPPGNPAGLSTFLSGITSSLLGGSRGTTTPATPSFSGSPASFSSPSIGSAPAPSPSGTTTLVAGHPSTPTTGPTVSATATSSPAPTDSTSSPAPTDVTSAPTLARGMASSGGATGGSGGSGGDPGADLGANIDLMPVGIGSGGIFAQAWWLHPVAPYDAPDVVSGPANGTDDQAPFRTLNALILSYIDSALGSIVPANTGGSNVVTNPAGLTVTAFDGLGTYTFSATGSYALDGQVLGGSFSTTDSASFTYSFHEAGFTPDGEQFTLDDSGGGTLNIHADNGSSLTHSLTNALTGSDSYALTQVLNQSDAVAGSYTADESTTDTTAGTDSFTLSETQTETVNTSGAITGGSDSYTFTETGTDTSSLAGQDGENVAGAAGVSDTGTASSTGAGSGGHTDSITGTDTLGAGGFLSSETNWFTWGGSDSESLTTSATDSDTVTAAGVGQTSSTTATETQSDSATLGETGTDSFSAVEGTSFTWTDWVNYLANSQDQGFDRGTETEGDSETNPDGSAAGGGGASFTITYTDNDPGSDFLIRSVDGTQVLTSG